jgi:hypothetical protein
MINELERIWKEAVGGLVDVLSRHLLVFTEKNHEKPYQDIRVLPEYE